MNLQSLFAEASDELNSAFEKQKATQDTVKDLKRTLKDTLDMIPEYLELQEKKKVLTSAKKELTDELKEIKTLQDNIIQNTDEFKEMEEFVMDQDEKFGKTKDKVISQLSRDLADQGIVAEINYKKGDLILIVARHN